MPIRQYCHPLVLVESFERGQLVDKFVADDISADLKREIAYVGMGTHLLGIIFC